MSDTTQIRAVPDIDGRQVAIPQAIGGFVDSAFTYVFLNRVSRQAMKQTV